jgi:hypothetical protein
MYCGDTLATYAPCLRTRLSDALSLLLHLLEQHLLLWLSQAKRSLMYQVPQRMHAPAENLAPGALDEHRLPQYT